MATITVGSNQTANGTSAADTFVASGSPSTNDIVYGHQGSDVVEYGATWFANSTIYGGQGDDTIDAGTHVLAYGNLGNDAIGVDDFSTVYGGQGDDTLRGFGFFDNLH